MTTVSGEIKYRSALLTIPRFNVKVRAALLGRTVYFPVKAVCIVLGLAPQKQRQRLQADSRFTEALCDIPINTVKGYRDTLCIRKDKVAAWLGLVEPSHCKLTKTREKLQEFQAELFAAADRFLWGDTGATPDADNAETPYVAEAQPASSSIITQVVTGILHLGACPNCGQHLCLILDATGAHLTPEPDEPDEQ